MRRKDAKTAGKTTEGWPAAKQRGFNDQVGKIPT